MRLLKLAVYGAFAFAFTLLLDRAPASSASEPFHEIVIEKRELKEKLCQEMSKFSQKHVADFFKRARFISAEARNDFNQLNCHIRGRLKKGNHAYRFDIQPVGLGSLTEIKSGTMQGFGCEGCEDLFPPK